MKKRCLLSRVKVALLILLTLSTIVGADLLLNYLSALPMLDGSIVCTSVLHKMFGIFGDHGWSLQKFLNAAEYSIWANVFIGLIYAWVCRCDKQLDRT